MVAIPKKDGNVRITVNYKKLNAISSLGQLPIPRVDEVLDSLGKGRIFSLFDLVSMLLDCGIGYWNHTIDEQSVFILFRCR